MIKDFQARYAITGIVFVVIMVLMSVRLFDLQFVKGEDYLDKAQAFSRKELRLTGPRGKILDRNGLPLAYNATSYSVQFVRDPSMSNTEGRAAYSKGMLLAIRIIEENGGRFLSTFAIRKLENGSYDFFWTGIDKAESPKTYEARVTKWKNENCVSNIKKAMTPEELFNACCEYYGVPAEASYDEKFKVLSVWQEVRSVYYASYMPVTLSQNVGMKTVAQIERQAIDLPGVQINMNMSRVYPNKTMASHIIGYMGRMLDEPTVMEMGKLGYKRDDLIGVSGIESSMESELSGNTTERTGLKVIEVNNLGKVARTIDIDNRSPKPGNNVVLTIDSKLQKRLEKALEENIALIRSAQEAQYNKKKEEYDEFLADRKDKSIHFAEVGAAVVMNVKTGEVLAMASYPSYDINIFNGGLGITEEDFAVLNTDKRNPLFNNAISSRGTPGSIFKMATGLAGLMEEKLLLNEEIDDDGYYNVHVKDTANDLGPACWVRPFSKHENQTIELAIKNSCNYFFFTVADRLGVERLQKWANLLGLTEKTGIELPNEVTGQIGSQESLYSKGHMSGVAALVRNQIVALMKGACEKAGKKYEDEKYRDVAIEIMDLVNAGLKEVGPDIRTILKNELGLEKADLAVPGKIAVDQQISQSLYEIKWNPNMLIEAGIGQSVTLLTPIAVARYISALVNGGDVFEARLIKSVITPEGEEIQTQPKLIRNLNVPDEYLQAIKRGMHSVVSDEEGAGTAADFFKDFPEEYQGQIGGKTGSAEVSKTIDLENNSWFVSFTPFDKPEIAVVVYIPSGWQGAQSSYTCKEIMRYYLDMKNLEKTTENLPQVNTMVK